MRILAFALLAALLGAIGGCGGHGADPAPPAGVEASVPASALASPAAFTTYVGEQPPDDRIEPLRLDGALPPVDDHAEPRSL